MSWKRTILLLLVLVGIAGFYYFKVHGPHSIKTVISFSPEPANAFILSLNERESVNSIVLHDLSKNTEISLHKVGKHDWRMRKPVDYPAESVIVDGFVSLLKLTPRVRQFSLDKLNEKEFGFDHPYLSICISTNLWSKERCLLVGSQAAIVAGSYAKWDDESQYFLVDHNFLKAFDKSVYGLRKKQIFTLLDLEINSVSLKSPQKQFEIKRSGKSWTLAKPIEVALSEDAVNELLVQLNSLYVKEFLDNERWDNSKFGLKPSTRLIRITFRDGSEQTLIQGREAAGKDAYYALSKEQNTVLLISLKKFNQVEEAFQKLT